MARKEPITFSTTDTILDQPAVKTATQLAQERPSNLAAIKKVCRYAKTTDEREQVLVELLEPLGLYDLAREVWEDYQQRKIQHGVSS